VYPIDVQFTERLVLLMLCLHHTNWAVKAVLARLWMKESLGWHRVGLSICNIKYSCCKVYLYLDEFWTIFDVIKVRWAILSHRSQSVLDITRCGERSRRIGHSIWWNKDQVEPIPKWNRVSPIWSEVLCTVAGTIWSHVLYGIDVSTYGELSHHTIRCFR